MPVNLLGVVKRIDHYKQQHLNIFLTTELPVVEFTTVFLLLLSQAFQPIRERRSARSVD